MKLSQVLTSEEIVIGQSLRDSAYQLRKAYHLPLTKWSARDHGWVIYPKGKWWIKTISITCPHRVLIKTHGKAFPTIAWSIASNLKARLGKQVFINGYLYKMS